jgi:hypothetical protein
MDNFRIAASISRTPKITQLGCSQDQLYVSPATLFMKFQEHACLISLATGARELIVDNATMFI